MTEQELLQMHDWAKAGTLQFKEWANGRYDARCEMVAFCTLVAKHAVTV